MKGIVIAGTASGVGKTIASLAVIRALENGGEAVSPAKAGPDFVDPSHHAAIAGRPSRTLDTWLEGETGVQRNYHRGDGSICVVEGVMGLYDGDHSSTAQVAEALDLPVVLVVDASAGMESVAAAALGFREYAMHAGRAVDVVGIIAQRAHGGRHERGIRNALPKGLTYFGRVPPRQGLKIPDRHLGLHMGTERPLETAELDRAAEHLLVERLIDAAREPPHPEDPSCSGQQNSKPSPNKRPSTDRRVAVARDEAFQFVYPAVLERLRERAEVVTFAPTAGDDLPACDGVYLPGGYPELHAERLADSPALETLWDRASEGLPVLGECGGMTVLAASITTAEDETHEMAGILPATVRMHDRYQALDHVELRAKAGTLTASAGATLRGHEFHYSSATVSPDARFAFDVTRGTGIDGEHDGLVEYSTLGTYAHVHADSGAFDAFIDSL
ncbi:MAG: cobyrinic acid a,c-diamide synthase [Halobacteriota archaeon]